MNDVENPVGHVGVRGGLQPERVAPGVRHDNGPPHGRVELDGPVRTLPGHLLHWNYRDLADHIRQVDLFSRVQAQVMFDEGVRLRLIDLLVRPLHRFVKGYFLRRGFLLGIPGFMVSVSTAYYVFMKYAKLWELERKSRE